MLTRFFASKFTLSFHVLFGMRRDQLRKSFSYLLCFSFVIAVWVIRRNESPSTELLHDRLLLHFECNPDILDSIKEYDLTDGCLFVRFVPH